MNIVDIVVVIALISSVIRGYQIGFVRQLGSTIGFVVGLLASVPLGQWASTFVSDSTSKMLLSTVILIIVTFGLMILGEYAGLKLKTRIPVGKFIDHIDNSAGTLMATITLAIGLWFMTAFISLLPSNAVQTQARQSFVYNFIDRHLPPASQTLASLNHLIDPNNTPLVFSGREPSPEANRVLPPVSNYTGIINKVSGSVVRVQGIGCGGLVNGSGWVLSGNRVVTNAHVVAGVNNPKVYDANGTHNARVVLFDFKNDVAVLAVSRLAGTPLEIDTTPLETNSTALIIGYPGGGKQSALTAAVLDRVDALGRDIYGQTKTVRNVYVLQTTVIPGNSGGPMLDTDGRVVGVVFGTSTTYNNVGYAFSIGQVLDEITAAKTALQGLSTGACSKG